VNSAESQEGGLPLKLTSLVRVDSKGRVTIPQTIREALGIDVGMTMVVIADIDRREIVLAPVSSGTSKLYEFIIDIADVTGALAKLTGKMAELGIDIVTSKCASIVRAELASCTIVADLTRAKSDDINYIRRELESLDVIRHVKIRPLGGSPLS
jgi:AbrB family looped-hinge helix DNA binding protein